MKALEELGRKIATALPGAIRSQTTALGELTLVAELSEIQRILSFLRDDPGCRFTVLIDIAGVDWPKRERRFDVVYHLLSLARNHRIRIKVETDENTPVPSSVSVYPAA